MRHSRLNLFVLIDALGWRFIEGREFLADLLPYRRPLRTVLGFSSGAIPTILTGLVPAQNGHWNLFYYDPAGSPFRWLRFFSFLPDRVFDHRVTRKILKELGRRVLGLGQNFECCVSPRLMSWFNYVEKRNIYDREGIPGARSIFDQLGDSGVPYRVYSYHRLSDEEILDQASQDVQAGKAEFFFLYLSEIDMFLHNHCNDPHRIEERLGWYDVRLRRLFEIARQRDSEAKLTVTSDHGMTPVRHHYNVVAEVDRLGFRTPGDYLAVYDSTMARFWFSTNQARREITARLETLPCGRILRDDELCRLGILFPDRRYGETIFSLHPGWLLSRSDFNGPGWVPAGMHGYHPDDPYSDAIFLSNTQPSVPMHTIADVYACMEQAAELTADDWRPSNDEESINHWHLGARR